MKKDRKDARFIFRVDNETATRLKTLAEEQKKTLSEIIRELIQSAPLHTEPKKPTPRPEPCPPQPTI
jgi:predicted HicB family RNase H-like nuclease